MMDDDGSHSFGVPIIYIYNMSYIVGFNALRGGLVSLDHPKNVIFGQKNEAIQRQVHAFLRCLGLWCDYVRRHMVGGRWMHLDTQCMVYFAYIWLIFHGKCR